MRNRTILSLLLTISGLFAAGELFADTVPFRFGTAVRPDGQTLYVDGTGILLNGEYVLPVMGEIHFSRVPERDWEREVRKMQAGGIDIIACYIFWGHHEMVEGQIDWSGNRNLRQFLEICRDCGAKVVLRSGPFCHGEVYLGGIPEWMVDKAAADPAQYALRTTAPGFIAAVSRFYDAVGEQAKGLLWKDGGPVIGAQVDNESSGPWPYLALLKEKIIAAGMDVPFYTRTGWPEMQGPAVFGEILPLYGDYADGFWDRELTDMPGEYRAAFRFKDSRLSAVIATEVFGTDQSTEMDAADLAYPYLTCELGGGMMTSYHRRIHIFDRDALALAICKVGSGSNLPGYYMYHGGTNPYCAEHSMAELQASKYTSWNDLPYMTYDFQAPLGEMGQPNQSYHYLRLLHQMLRDWGGELAPMQPEFGTGPVRTATRRDGDKGFVFVNNYERMATLGGAGVAEQPVASDFDAAAAWSLPIPALDQPDDWFLEIDYDGDVARVYADGRLVEDNFWNGRRMLVRVSDLVGKQAELRILPLRKDAPIYLQAEQRAALEAAPGETLLTLRGIRLIHRVTKR